jgi:hypothetical protein
MLAEVRFVNRQVYIGLITIRLNSVLHTGALNEISPIELHVLNSYLYIGLYRVFFQMPI